MATTRFGDSLKSKIQFNQITLLLLFVLSTVVLHRTNLLVSYVFFAIMLFYLFRSGNIMMILAYLLITLNSPGNLISEGLLSTKGRLPYIPLASGLSIGFSDIFVLMFIFLLGRYPKRLSNSYKHIYFLYAVYGAILVLVSLILGTKVSTFVLIGRIMLYYTLFYMLFDRKFANDDELSDFLSYLKVIVFIAVSQQLSSLVFGRGIWSIIAGTSTVAINFEDYEGALGGLRIVEAGYINLITTMLLTYRINKKIHANQDFFWLMVCYGSAFLTATRGWIIAYSFILFISLLTNSATRLRLVYAIAVVSIIVVMGIGQSSVIVRQISLSLNRVGTLTGIAEGDLTAEGSLTRLTSRNEPVIENWRRNPIIGWGFSTQSKSDGHVGNQNVLQVSGVIGFLIILFGWLAFFVKNISHGRANRNMVNVFGSLNVMMLALIIIHSSSTQMFGYDVVFQPFIKIFVVLLAFHLSNLAIQQSKNMQRKEFETA